MFEIVRRVGWSRVRRQVVPEKQISKASWSRRSLFASSIDFSRAFLYIESLLFTVEKILVRMLGRVLDMNSAQCFPY